MKRQDLRNVYVGIKGFVVALDRTSGAELWRTPLAGSSFVNVVQDGADLFAATRGRIFCLDPGTGAIRWQNGLPGMGYGLATFAGQDNSGRVAMAQSIFEQEAAAATAG